MVKKVTKAVITAGGYATRFLPISKAIPKEMLPVGNKPAIHYILDELAAAGITDVLILLGRGRECLMNYLDKNYELDTVLAEQKGAAAPETNFFPQLNIYYRRVPMPLGVTDCVAHAESFVAGEPFVLAYCDDIFMAGNPTQELLTAYQTNGQPGLVVTTVPAAMASQYGIIDDNGQIIEKPKNPPSNLAAVGRYLLPGNIFATLGDDIIAALNGIPHKNVITTKSKRFDVGNPAGLYAAFQYIMSQN